MKKIYFIRHAESEGNSSGKSQDEFSELTENGKSQAILVADQLCKYNIDIIISSPNKRAKDTAKIIADKLNKPLQISDLFIERVRPEEQIGLLKYKDPRWIEIENIIKYNFDNNNFKFSNEENIFDLKNRAEKCFNFLENNEEGNILVVSHAVFLKFLLAYFYFQEEINGKKCEKFMSNFHINNTGIIIFEIYEQHKEKIWHLDTWNNYSHLS